MSFIRLIAPLLLSIVFLQSTMLAGSTSLPLVLVVRDGQGSPLVGITLRLLLAGPPPEPFDNCVTDQNGQCRLMIPPGSYIVQFEGGGWGRHFIPAAEQNAGGGFGIAFEPSNQEQVVTFVIGERDGQLVPLWDMSRDPNALPQPLAPSGDPLPAIDLGPLATTTGQEAQIIESTLGVRGTSTPIPGQTSTATPPADQSKQLSIFWPVVLSIVIATALLALMLLNVRWTLRHKETR